MAGRPIKQARLQCLPPALATIRMGGVEGSQPQMGLSWWWGAVFVKPEQVAGRSWPQGRIRGQRLLTETGSCFLPTPVGRG